MAELHVLRSSTLLDVAATLRTIADGIDAGEYGQTLGCVVVLDARALDVFYTGTGEAGPNTMALLQCALGKMVARVLEEKG